MRRTPRSTTRWSASTVCAGTRARGLRVFEEYGTDDVLPNSGRCRGLAGAALRSVQRLSGGRLTATHDHLGFVLEKPV